MNSKSKKKVNKSKEVNKHLNYLIDCNLNETKETKTDKIRSKLFQLNATKDEFNSQKAFNERRLQLMTQLAEEMDRSDAKNTYLSEELIEYNTNGRTDRSFAEFDSHLYGLNEQQICQQLDLKPDVNDSDDCQMIAIVLKKSSDIETIHKNNKNDKKKTNNTSNNERQVEEVVSNDSQSLPKNNLLHKLGSFSAQPKSQSKSFEKSSDGSKTSNSSPNKVPGLFKSTNSPINKKRENSDICEERPQKRSFMTGFEKKTVDDLKKGSIDLCGARKALNKVNSFRPPIKSSEGNCFSSANGPELDSNLKNVDKNLIEKIENEIITQLDPIGWEEVAGLEYAKKRINEIAILPLKKPHLFTGLRRPPKGILLFGPPGTGKTFLGRLIASQTKSTFFSITVSALNSKWIGEGEKTIKAMFAVARARQPSVIFIDEIDSLLTTRSDTEHESSRRMKTEFFTQFEGVTTASVDKILIIGATNRPQDLDDAARRRLAARLYIRLPDLSARKQMITNCISKEKHDLTEEQIQTLAEKTDGYSGADMRELCRESAMEAIRDLDDSMAMDDSDLQLRDIAFNDFLRNLSKVKPTVRQEDLQQFEDWNRQFGTNDSK